ncbi:helix-turn-helix transcriptional regulator [Nocardiopsis sp. YSL2]|uniref:helix-turn-helix domain-containing protein n=1 Tax=Nocardiopsis sp. YSL2 TaxID=2939492 RepID=UPI0026F4223E|nr:helix-turn-helix transcriptional regulator [Nocardiopsis sp. YSL2]
MSSPTLRRKRLARQLRQLREERRLNAEDVAAEAKRRSGKPRGWSLSKLIRMEKANWKRLNLDDLAVLLDIYEITDTQERLDLITLAREGNQRGWWASFGDALGTGQFVGLESEASRIRTYQCMTIPGLLQTPEYARAMISTRGMVDETELNLRVQARMFRKSIFNTAPIPTLWAIIDEAALARIPPDLHGQLEYLIEASLQPNIGIQVLPLSYGLHAAMTGQMVLLEFPAPDPPVVYIEVLSEELYLEKPQQVTHYQHLYDHVQAAALPVDQSRDYIRGLLNP